MSNTSPSNPITVQMKCLFVGCKNQGPLRVVMDARGNANTTAQNGWVCYALGFPTKDNLGICPQHQSVTLQGPPPIDVRVSPGRNGTDFEVLSNGAAIGKVWFPTNTLTLTVPAGSSHALQTAGPHVAQAYGFKV